MSERDRLRPLGIGELLDAAVRLCTTHAGPLVKAVLVVVLPVQILSAAVLAATVSDPDLLNVTRTDAREEDSGAFWAGQIGVAALSGVSFLLATGACFHAIAQAWLGRRPDWRASLRFAGRRAPSLLWVSVLFGLGIALGFVACIVPGVWLAIAWSVALPALLVEDARGPRALQRSFRLTQDRWWASLGVLAIGFLLAAVVSSIFTFGLGLLAFAEDSLAFLILLTTLGTLLSALLTTPLQAAIVSVLYFDLRLRKEGLDPHWLGERLAGGAPLATAAPAPEQTWQAPAGWQPPVAPPTPPPADAGEPPQRWLPPAPGS